jgi:D-sedoheptulose 7-phosphate isomerase
VKVYQVYWFEVVMLLPIENIQQNLLKMKTLGRDGGYTKILGDNVIIIPTVNKKNVTPYVESFQAVIWHSIVSHPLLQSNKTKW